MTELTKDRSDKWQRTYKRALSCAQMIFPDCEVTANSDSSAAGMAIIIHVVGSNGRMSMGLEVCDEATNAKMLEEMTEAASRYAIRNRGKIQPFVPGLDPDDQEPWPEEHSVEVQPPADEWLVVSGTSTIGEVQVSHSDIAMLRFWKWFTRSSSGPSFGVDTSVHGYIPTRWRRLSAYERATLPERFVG